jgi:hypothetical protein
MLYYSGAGANVDREFSSASPAPENERFLKKKVEIC